MITFFKGDNEGKLDAQRVGEAQTLSAVHGYESFSLKDFVVYYELAGWQNSVKRKHFYINN